MADIRQQAELSASIGGSMATTGLAPGEETTWNGPAKPLLSLESVTVPGPCTVNWAALVPLSWPE